jgi:hypothetical protein
MTTVVATAAPPSPRRYLFGPAIDFLCLGGGWLLVMPILLLLPTDQYRPSVLTLVLWLSNVINFPHFAHSYQIFYSQFRKKILSSQYTNALKCRYVLAGIVIPTALAVYLLVAVTQGDNLLLRLSVSAMSLLVGWHYVKQGYGMLIVDSVMKQRLFHQNEKNIILLHSYVLWMFSWIRNHDEYSEKHFIGISHYTFSVPEQIEYVFAAATVLSGLAVLRLLFNRWRARRGLPLTGLAVYAITLYLWVLFASFHPLWVLVIPTFHSLQYLVVVWRYKANLETADPGSAQPPRQEMFRKLFDTDLPVRILKFVVVGIILGVIGFWVLPISIQLSISYNREIYGPSLLIFLFWIFINIHHYFIDNVIWRRENPDTLRYVFR